MIRKFTATFVIFITFTFLHVTSSSASESCRDKKDTDEINFSRCLGLAKSGDANAQFFAGLMYRRGDGVEKNLSESVEWFKKAAAQGHVKGQQLLGGMYFGGLGVEKNPAKAKKYFKKAFDQYKKAADQGDAEGQFNLGIIYAHGLGVEVDHSMAAKLYKKSAEQGYAEAQVRLSSVYFSGKGVEQNNAVAEEWLRKAAEQGYDKAQYRLGAYYDLGKYGFKKDPNEAAKWYRKAAEQGHKTAGDKLARLGNKEKLAKIDAATLGSGASKATTTKYDTWGNTVSLMALAEHGSTSSWGVMCSNEDKDGELRGVIKIKDDLFYVKNSPQYRYLKYDPVRFDFGFNDKFEYYVLGDRKIVNASFRKYSYNTIEGKKIISLYMWGFVDWSGKEGGYHEFTYQDGDKIKKIKTNFPPVGDRFYIQEDKQKFGCTYGCECSSIGYDSLLKRNHDKLKIAAFDRQVMFADTKRKAKEEKERLIAEERRISKEKIVAQNRKEIALATKNCSSNKTDQRKFSGCLTLANNGKSNAQKQVADMYFNGSGVGQDYTKSLFWYKKLASKEDAYAKSRLPIVTAKIAEQKATEKIKRDEAREKAKEKEIIRLANTWYSLVDVDFYKKRGVSTSSRSLMCKKTKSPASSKETISFMVPDAKFIDEVERGNKVVEVTLTYTLQRQPYAERFFRGRERCRQYVREKKSMIDAAQENKQRALDKYR